MRTHFFIALTLLLVGSTAMVGCKKVSSREDLQKVQELEKKAQAERAELLTGNADTALLGELGRAYISFADNYPQAPETPEFLFRAGELYSNDLGDLPRALQVFKRNYTDYPNHETAASALFLLAFLNHNVLQDLIEAEKYYREFIELHPNHKMASTAQFELEHLGQTPEEIFRSFDIEEEAPVDTSAIQLP